MPLSEPRDARTNGAAPPPTVVAGWDGRAYAANNAHHRAFDASVLSPLAIEPAWAVLDVGCGTGDFSARVAGLVPAGRVLGVDASASQIEVARLNQSSVGNLTFLTWDARRLAELPRARVPPPGFDLVVSVATLHWIGAADHPAVFDGMRAVLRPGGILRAEFGGAGQIAETRQVLDELSAELGGPASPWNFPTPEVVTEMVTAAGFDVAAGWARLVDQDRSLPDEEAFVGWLTSQVLIAYEAGLPEGAAHEFRARALERCLARCRRPDGSYDQHYVRLDLLATAA